METTPTSPYLTPLRGCIRPSGCLLCISLILWRLSLYQTYLVPPLARYNSAVQRSTLRTNIFAFYVAYAEHLFFLLTVAPRSIASKAQSIAGKIQGALLCVS